MQGTEWAIASEDCSFGPIAFERVRDVQPGEMVIITTDGQLVTKQCVQGQLNPCIFEYIYLSRCVQLYMQLSADAAWILLGFALHVVEQRVTGQLKPCIFEYICLSRYG
jgi:glutamine phosphoribosylpyrophosphate amidotransferase